MLLEQQKKQFNTLNDWFYSPLGLAVADQFKMQLTLVLDYLKGDSLIQLGSCGQNPWLDILQFKDKWLVSPFAIKNQAHLVSSLNQIPLVRNSVDCILAPLTIEPFTNTTYLIDELDRILKPMGYIVFFGINPWSLWGAAIKCGLLHCFIPHKIRLHSPFHLNRVLMQRGYRQCSLSNFHYIPPINNQSLLKKMQIFNEIGKIFWPFPSGFYCYIAQKYEHITPSPLIHPIRQDQDRAFESALQPLSMRLK